MARVKRQILGDMNERADVLTTEALSDLVLDHILDNQALFLAGAGQGNGADHFIRVLDSMTALAQEVAHKALANRVVLSPLKTLANDILADPDQDQGDTPHEMRYRIIEQYGDNPPVKDDIYTLDEAIEIYGDSFVERYWGKLGENCPSRVTTSQDRQLWFSVVRYPTDSLVAKQGPRQQENENDDVLDSITRSPAFK